MYPVHIRVWPSCSYVIRDLHRGYRFIIPCLFSIFSEPSVDADVENRRGIWTVKIQNNNYILLECSDKANKPLTNRFAIFLTSRRYISIISPLCKQKINIGTDMETNPYCKQIILSFCYCNSFFKISKNIKLWWDAILQKKNCPYPLLD